MKPSTDKPAAVYLRVSSKRQEERNGTKSQAEAIRRWLAYEQIAEHEVYEDLAKSGKTTDRPDFIRLMEACRAGRHGLLVTYSLSRLARNTRRLLEVCDELDELGVRVVAVKESIDTSTAMGRCVRTILAAVDEMERERTAERVSDGIRAKLAAGEPWGCRPKMDIARVEALVDQEHELTESERRAEIRAIAADAGVKPESVRQRMSRIRAARRREAQS